MIPNNFADKADERRSWQEEVADSVDTMTPGMKKVLAEIDQTKYGKVMEEHSNFWRLLRRITEEELKKVVMSIKDEEWLQGLAEIETAIRTWTGKLDKPSSWRSSRA